MTTSIVGKYKMKKCRDINQGRIQDLAKGGGADYGEHMQRKLITGLWGQSPQQDPGAEPLVGGQGRSSPEADSFLYTFVQKRGQTVWLVEQALTSHSTQTVWVRWCRIVNQSVRLWILMNFTHTYKSFWDPLYLQFWSCYSKFATECDNKRTTCTK